MFLWTLGHNIKNRIIQKRFGRSGKIVCAVIHAVLTSILNMRHTLYRRPFPVPNHCQHANWKHFKVCFEPLTSIYPLSFPSQSFTEHQLSSCKSV
ncbi:hypothetical protein LINPERHAP1_LOCUS18521 [Linum perenne]